MKCSFVIPTYNSAELTVRGVRSFLGQSVLDSVDFEVIVVDDGSSDDTEEKLNEFRSHPRFRSIFIPRTENSSRSKARNVGLAAATGDLVSFFDSGVLVDPHFLQKTCNYFQLNGSDRVLVHYTYGLNVEPHEINEKLFAELDLCDPKAYRPHLDPKLWADPRHELLAKSLLTFSAPWYCGFLCAMTASKKALDAVGGLDEEYLGWGVEDIDLSYRLYLHGQKFDRLRDVFAFHYPHPIHNRQAKAQNEAKNKVLMNRKYRTLETQLYALLDGRDLHAILESLKAVRLSELIDRPYPTDLLTRVLGSPPNAPQEPCLSLFFEPWIEDRTQLSFVHFVHQRELLDGWKIQNPQAEVFLSAAWQTEYSDGHFCVCIVSDLLRVLRSEIQFEIVRELSRISRRVVLLVSQDTSDEWKELYAKDPIPGTNWIRNPKNPTQVMERIELSSLQDLEELIREFSNVEIESSERVGV